jgi:uncharacterized protein YajQ (UPF0234 family)
MTPPATRRSAKLQNKRPNLPDIMPDNSFDIVSKIDMTEVLNAVEQTRKEVSQRFDLKGSGSKIELQESDHKVVVTSVDDYKLAAVNDVLQQRLVKRKVPLKGLTYGVVQPVGGSSVRQEINIQSGISVDKCREIVKALKSSNLKVQASIQGDLVRVSGKSRDLLQDAIQCIKENDFGVHIEFTNYRTK